MADITYHLDTDAVGCEQQERAKIDHMGEGARGGLGRGKSRKGEVDTEARGEDMEVERVYGEKEEETGDGGQNR